MVAIAQSTHIFHSLITNPTHKVKKLTGDKSTPEAATAMQPLELTLIVAATRNMGIGLNGSMPWTGLRREMRYFARVTTRLPPQVKPPAPSSDSLMIWRGGILTERQKKITRQHTPPAPSTPS